MAHPPSPYSEGKWCFSQNTIEIHLPVAYCYVQFQSQGA